MSKKFTNLKFNFMPKTQAEPGTNEPAKKKSSAQRKAEPKKNKPTQKKSSAQKKADPKKKAR